MIKSRPTQVNQTYAKIKKTAMKNTTHMRQPTPVRSAIRSIRFIFPRRRTRVLSKVSLRSVRFEVSRISSPMASVICKVSRQVLGRLSRRRNGTYILQHLHLGTNTLHLCIILRLQRRKNSVGVLSPTAHISTCHKYRELLKQTYLEFGVALRNPPDAPPLIYPLSRPALEYPP